MNDNIKKILKFICVGISNTIISLIIYYCLKFIGVNYLISMAVGYIISSITGYFLNKIWVFKDKNKKIKSLLRYYILYISSLLLNLAFTYFQVDILNISDNIAPLFTIIIITVYNYIVSNNWVFNSNFKFDMKKIIKDISNNKMFYVALVIMLIMVTFLFINNKYIHPVADDYSNYNSLVAFASDGKIDTPLEYLRCTFNRTIDIYKTWQGTYFSNIFFSLNPLLVSVNLYKFVMLLIQIVWLGSTLYLFSIIPENKSNRRESILLGMIFIIFSILSFYSLGEGFYWFTGTVLYILPYSLSLILLALIIGYLRNNKKIYLFLISILLVLVAGTNYVTGLFIGFVLACITLHMFINKNDKKYVFLILTLLFSISFLFNVLCPGNFNRVVETENVSNFKILKIALVNSYEMIKYLLFKTIYIPLILISIPVIKKIIVKSKIKFINPLILFGLCTICFICLFIPMAFSYKNFYQETRVENIQLLYLVIMLTICIANSIGYNNKNNSYDSVLSIVGISLAIVMISTIGTDKMQGFILIDDVLYGRSLSYDICLNSMEKVLSSKKYKVKIKTCSVYPESIHYYKMENTGWINDAMSKYYNKVIEVEEYEN